MILYKLPPSYLFVLFALLDYLLSKCWCIKILEAKVPSIARAGDIVILTCTYDLEGQSLYSLNWWKDNDQFYQYTPAEKVKKITYEATGVVVDKSESNLRDVVLTNITFDSGGEFKCEVVADFPSYERDTATVFMKVIEIPVSFPIVTSDKSHYHIGDHLRSTCRAPAEPHQLPNITWYFNGHEVDSNHVTQIFPWKQQDVENEEGEHIPLAFSEEKKEHIFLREHNKEKEEGEKAIIIGRGSNNKRKNLSIDHVTSHITFKLKKKNVVPHIKNIIKCTAVYSETFSRSRQIEVTIITEESEHSRRRRRRRRGRRN